MKKYFAIFTVVFSFIFTGCFTSRETQMDFFRDGEGVSFSLDKEDLTYYVGEEITVTYTTDISATVFDYAEIHVYVHDIEPPKARVDFDVTGVDCSKRREYSYEWKVKSSEFNSEEKKLILKINEALEKCYIKFYLMAYSKKEEVLDTSYQPFFYVSIKDPSAEMAD